MELPKPKFKVAYRPMKRPKKVKPVVQDVDPQPWQEDRMAKFQQYLDSIDYDYQAILDQKEKMKANEASHLEMASMKQELARYHQIVKHKRWNGFHSGNQVGLSLEAPEKGTPSRQSRDSSADGATVVQSSLPVSQHSNERSEALQEKADRLNLNNFGPSFSEASTSLPEVAKLYHKKQQNVPLFQRMEESFKNKQARQDDQRRRQAHLNKLSVQDAYAPHSQQFSEQKKALKYYSPSYNAYQQSIDQLSRQNSNLQLPTSLSSQMSRKLRNMHLEDIQPLLTRQRKLPAVSPLSMKQLQQSWEGTTKDTLEAKRNTTAKSAMQVQAYVRRQHKALRQEKDRHQQAEMDKFQKRKNYGEFIKQQWLPPVDLPEPHMR